jgi:hypothetical protein
MSHAFAFKESDHLSETESGESSDWSSRLIKSGRTLCGDVMLERRTHTSPEISPVLVCWGRRCSPSQYLHTVGMAR